MRTITKRLEIDVGHRLMKHEGKCRYAHGHHYAFELTVGAETLDEVGRIIDFSVLKEKVGGWLDKYWDHGFIAQRGDPIIDWLLENKQKVQILDTPPTIENLVEVVFFVATALLRKHGILVTHVVGFETPTSSAAFDLTDSYNVTPPLIQGIPEF